MDKKAVHAEALKRFKLAKDASETNRRDAAEDLKFLWNEDNCQWPEDVRDMRKGRPMVVENRLPQFVRQVVNEQRRNRPAINIIPADGKASPETAEILEGMVRSIERASRADMAYDTALESAASCGIGYFEICTDYVSADSFDQEILVKPIANPLTVYDDPDCKMPDNSDREYCFVSEMMDRGEFRRRFGKDATSFDDADEDMLDWYDEDKVRVAKYWRVVKEQRKIHQLETGEVLNDEQLKEIQKLAGKKPPIIASRDVEARRVECYMLTGDEVFSEYEYKGQYIPVVYCPGAMTNIEGKRRTKSLIRDALDAQRVNNYMLSSEIELSALQPRSPWIGPVGAFDDDERWNSANTDNHPYLEYAGNVAPQRIFPTPPPAHIINARMAVIEGMKAIMGMYDASLGARSNETSGVAIQARQQEGDNATYHFIDNMTRAIRYAGMVIVDLIPHVYDAERVVRLLNIDGTAEMQAVNNVLTPSLDVGKYDVSCTAGPSFQTQRQETRAAMIELIGKFPQLAQVAGDLVVKNMDFPDADELAKRVKKMLPPGIDDEEGAPQQPPPPSPEMVKAQNEAQAAQAKMQMDAQMSQAKMQQEAQATQAKIQSEAMIAQYKADKDAEVARYRAELEMQTKLQLAAVTSQATIDDGIAQGVSANTGEIAQTVAMGLAEQMQALSSSQAQNTEALLGAIAQQSQAINGQAQIMRQALEGVAQALSKRKNVIRDDMGNLVGVE